MKVFLHYQDNANDKFHKSLKITLPKSWKSGPTSRLLTQFVESYNASKAAVDKDESGDGDDPISFSDANPLDASSLHFVMEKNGNEATNLHNNLSPIGSDAVVLSTIPDRANLYVRHGASKTSAELPPPTTANKPVCTPAATTKATTTDNNNVQCTHFGCRTRFPRGGPYPPCTYHVAPPVFHETAKFWSCCPNKKAYDWDDFQEIVGCRTGVCTDVRPQQGDQKVLGGMDLREIAAEKAGVRLKSIDDFNQGQMAGGSDRAPMLVKLKSVLCDELGTVEHELFDQVVDGMKAKHVAGGGSDTNKDEDVWGAVADELGGNLKAAFKKMAVDQLRLS